MALLPLFGKAIALCSGMLFIGMQTSQQM